MARTNTITVLFFLRRIGPYHHARFQEARKSLDLIVVETRPHSQEYSWQFHPADAYKIDRLSITDDPEKGLRGKALRNEVDAMAEKFQPQVVVTTGWADPEYHAVVLAASRRGIPCVVISDSRYEDEPRKRYKEFVKRLVLQSYSAALVAGTSSREYLVRLGFNNSAIFQPWDVVDNHYFTREGRNDVSFQDRYFLCVSRFIPKKNLNRLIEAFGIYKKNGGRRSLLLLGSGELEGSIKARIGEMNLSDDVQLKGFVQYENLPHYFSRALGLILPSISDQWGLVVNEAMAAGLPVLVSNQCGCAIDLVHENENGCTFDPYQISSMVEALIYLDKQIEPVWRRMSEASKRVIEHWDLVDFSQGLIKACEKATSQPGRIIMKPLHLFLSR
jgi:glycosyltransferase involved in cell wall biosynthesis